MINTALYNLNWHHTMNQGIYPRKKKIMYRTEPRHNLQTSVHESKVMHLQSAAHQCCLVIQKESSMKAFKRELSLVAMKYVPPTSVQLTLLDQ